MGVRTTRPLVLWCLFWDRWGPFLRRPDAAEALDRLGVVASAAANSGALMMKSVDEEAEEL